MIGAGQVFFQEEVFILFLFIHFFLFAERAVCLFLDACGMKCKCKCKCECTNEHACKVQAFAPAHSKGRGSHLLIVDFHVRDFDLVRGGLLSAGSDPLEEGVAEARDQALVVRRAHHGVGLARACEKKREDVNTRSQHLLNCCTSRYEETSIMRSNAD